MAERDALQSYKTLDAYTVHAQLRDRRWYVTYTLEPGFRGGGPSFVIDGESGAILAKQYSQ